MKNKPVAKIEMDKKKDNVVKVHPSKVASRNAAKAKIIAPPIKLAEVKTTSSQKQAKIMETNSHLGLADIKANVGISSNKTIPKNSPVPNLESVIATENLNSIISSEDMKTSFNEEKADNSIGDFISENNNQLFEQPKPYGPSLKLPFAEFVEQAREVDNSLPMALLEKYGLAKDGKLLLKSEDINALMNGLRTSMIEVLNLTNSNGESIDKINVKVSLAEDKSGELDFLFHPIYPEAKYPDFLTADEASKLEQGETVSITKKIIEDGVEKLMIVEFDDETKEFLYSDTSKLHDTYMMTSENLTEEQKDKFRRGKIVELSDGTRFRFSATDPLGIRAEKILLIASILIDGGLSYIFYSGIKALMNRGKQGTLEDARTEGYEQALKDYNIQQIDKQKQDLSKNSEQSNKNEQSRGYEKSRMTSR